LLKKEKEGEEQEISNTPATEVAVMTSTIPYRAGEMTEGYKDIPSSLVECTSEKKEKELGL
jgi:hypothetical protein